MLRVVVHDIFLADFFAMPLLVGQLIYTSLPKTGFQLLTSQQVPLTVQDAFVEEIVFQMWSAYNPPPLEQQASFLHQIVEHQTLFGWLYNDGADELGRSHIPYFLGYYLTGLLSEKQLLEIFGYLSQGPIYFLERARLPRPLENVILPELEDYQPARLGVSFPPSSQTELCRELRNRRLIQRQRQIITTLRETLPVNEEKPHLLMASPHLSSVPDSSLQQIEHLFHTAIQDKRGLEGLVLLSDTGHPLTSVLGMSAAIAADLAPQMLALVQASQKQLCWSSFNHLSFYTSAGHLVLSSCFEGCYLLTKTEAMLTGVLEVEIKRLLKKIQAIHSGEEQLVAYTSLVRRRAPNSETNSSNEPLELESRQGEEILYRGRRPNP
jgi:hypothetical protein